MLICFGSIDVVSGKKPLDKKHVLYYEMLPSKRLYREEYYLDEQAVL